MTAIRNSIRMLRMRTGWGRGVSWFCRFLRRFAMCVLIAGFAAWLALHLVPIPSALLHVPEQSVEFTDRNGAPLRNLLVDDRHFAAVAPLDQIPQSLIDATICAEDKRFWTHPGVDFFAAARALADYAQHRRIISGASTITEQLVKISASRPRNLRAKFCEAIIALRIEQSWSKRQILESYLNRLDYGNLRVGSASAAQFYFGKPLADLSLAESAFLAGLPQAPARLNPFVHLERAKKRQAWVLAQMLRNGKISAENCQRALAENLRLVEPRRVFEAPHFVDLLLKQGNIAELRGKKVRTTLDLELTQFAEQRLRENIERLRAENVRNGALVVIENRTGNVLALVGSENYFAPGAGQVNGAWARRSPGSTIKPFTYLLAFERGATPASIVADLPAEFATATGIYHPENYDHHCYGPMRYRLALANSLNISAVKVLNSIGGAGILQKRLQECGFTTLDRSAEHYGLGLTIGNAEARLLELTNAYACLARLGEFKPFHLLADEKEIAKQVGDASAAYLIADILSDNSARVFSFGVNSSLRFDFPVACKTGTSTDFRDNWAIGYTPEFTVGVWAGNFDGTPMSHVSGVSGTAPILHDVFEFLHQQYGTSWYSAPLNIVQRAIQPLTGKLLAVSDENSLREKFISNFLPPLESTDDYDARGRVRLGAEYARWFASGGNSLSGRAVVDELSGARKLRIVRPLPGTVCVLDPDLPASSRELRLVAEGSDELVWKSRSLDIHAQLDRTCAVLREGRHVFTVLDPKTGQTAETWVMVKSL
jgi:penicillin-binding protein 1C